MRSIKLRPRDPELPQRKVRLRLPGRLSADLDAYREVYARTHGREIELPALIEGILEQFLAGDRTFQRHRRGRRLAAGASAEEPGEAQRLAPLDAPP
jgi:hypothetical protein